MRVLIQLLKRAGLQILLLLLCYFLCRSLFTLINLDRFEGLTVSEYFRLAFHGLRYDISTVVSINGLYFILLLLPLPVWRSRAYLRTLQWLFIVTNVLAFAFEISDWAYFPFSLKRSTSDVLDMISRKGDFVALLPHFITDYWYAPFGILLLIIGLYHVNKRICKYTQLQTLTLWNLRTALLQTLALILVTGLSVIGMRGGLQLIPLGNGNALQVAENKFVPIVLNTPFSIMHSYSGKLEELHYYSEDKLRQYVDPIKQYSGRTFEKKNVVFLLLESFGKEYTGLGGRTSYTPFLDSLMGQSYVCRNAYANALRSAEGIPAILSGVPSLMDEPITTSSYGTNRLTSLPALLREQGYETAFFHGGTNGTMSFDIYAANAGFRHYYGRTEYNNEKDYDGNWGIWDEPFLQFTVQGISRMSQPFMASVFTLSSHDPFKVPVAYRDRLPRGTQPIHQCIAYTDMALRRFFESASKEPWYRNTLFVITADHSAPVSKDPYYSSLYMGAYAIPLLFLAPGDSTLAGTTDTVVQQLDILPSVLDYLGYEKPFFAFGNSIFRPAYPRFVINRLSGSYNWYMDGYLLVTKALEPAGLYQFGTDSLCKRNILTSGNELANKTLIPYFRAFVQQYRSALIRNQMYTTRAGG